MRKRAGRAPDTATELVQLGEAHPVGVVDDECVDVGDVDAGLDNGGAYQDIQLLVQEPPPDFESSPPPMRPCATPMRASGTLLAGGRRSVPGANIIVEIVHLPAPAELTADGVGQNADIVFKHIGLHRVSVVRRFLNDGHIADARKRHAERPGNQG